MIIYQPKHCNKCSITKSIIDFYKDNSKKDGHCSTCKQCQLSSKKHTSRRTNKNRKKHRIENAPLHLPIGHYVYAYLRKDYTIYYIGKGTKKRAWQKCRGEIGIPPTNDRIIIIFQGLSEIGALAYERQLIRWYGRKDNNTGILRNKTDGGDGASGVTRSESTRKKQSIATLGKPKYSIRCKKVISPSGKVYDKITDAAVEHGVTLEGIRYRCSVNKDGWRYG